MTGRLPPFRLAPDCGMHRLVHFGRGAVVAGVVVLGLVLPACSRSDATPPSPTVRAESTTTSTTTVEQSYAIPDVIDAAYVNRVLAALEHVAGDVVRRIHATGQFTPDDLIPLRAIYNDPEFEIQTQLFATLVGEASTQHSPPGDNLVSVRRLIAANPRCIYAQIEIDATPTVLDPPPPRTTFVELQSTQPGADPSALNPTPWSVSVDEPSEEARCAG